MQPCPLCQANESMLFHSYDKFTLVMCKSCHLIYQLQVDNVEIISLFSREEPTRLEYDLRIHPVAVPDMTERDKTKMLVGLQSGWHGHEIFCVAGASHE